MKRIYFEHIPNNKSFSKKAKKLGLLSVVFLFLGVNNLFAQLSEKNQRELDSLNGIINNKKSPDTTLASAYLEISELLSVSSLDTMLFLSEKAKEIAEKALETSNQNSNIKKSLQRTLAGALQNIGYVYNKKNNPIKGLEYYHKSIALHVKIGNKKGVAKGLNNVGFFYYQKGDIPKALEYFHKSLTIQEEIGEKKGVAVSSNNIGYIYQHQDDISKALEYYQKSLKIHKEIEDERGVASNLNNIGYIYKLQGDTSKALTYYLKGLKIREEIGDRIGVGTSLNNIGSIYEKQGDIAKALAYYQESLAIREEVGSKRSIALSLTNIGKLEIEKKALSDAENHLDRGLNLAQEVGSPSLISSAAKQLSKLAKQQENYSQALEMYELHILMRDSLNNKKTQKATAQQQAKSEYEKQKAIDDVKNEKLLAIEQEKKEKQQIFTFATIGVLALVVLFLLFVFNRLRITKKQKALIQKQKETVQLAHKKTQQQKIEIEAQKADLETTHLQLAEHHKEITDSINYAERIQRSFLATAELLDANLPEYFVFFKPKDVVSGDFYWAGQLKNGCFAVVTADSTGHGVPGAIMSILNISSIEKAVEQGLTQPSEIFNHTRKTIIERLKKDGSEKGGKDGMDATIIAYDFPNNKITITSANNPVWIVRENDEEVMTVIHSEEKNVSKKSFRNSKYELITIKADKMPVGKHDFDHISFTQEEFKVQKGDIIYTLTDGYPDQFGGPKGKKFMSKKLKLFLLEIAHLPLKEQQERLNNRFTEWCGQEEQIDDVCIIGVKI